jgi:hypothetical protein
VARFDYALQQRARISDGEMSEYRAAADVVIVETQCFPSRTLRSAATRFKAQTARPPAVASS